MSDKSFLRKVIDVALTISVGAVVSFSARKIVVGNRDYLKNSNLIPKVTSELNVDTKMIRSGDLQYEFSRLKPNLNKKVMVYIDDSVPENTKNNIKNTLNEFNYVFDYINNDYNLEVCNYAEYLANKAVTNSTIKFVYKNIDKNDFGDNKITANKSLFHKIFTPNSLDKNVYIVGSTIYLNKTYFDNMTDFAQKDVISHELLHSFGFNDTYNADFEDETSLMNIGYQNVINILGPNDVKRLYCAYGKKHINSDGSFNQEKMDEVKEYINAYEDSYYEKLVSVIKNETGVEFEKINKEDLRNFEGKTGRISVKLDENAGSFSYVEDKENKTGTGRVIMGADYAILPDIKSGNYTDFLIVIKNQNKLKVYNLSVYRNVGDKKEDIAKMNYELSLE